jgi:hypothetical protein
MSLLEANPNAPRAWLDEMPVSSRYTAGLAGERFLRALKEEGVIYGTRCQSCEITYVPARLFCERCMGELSEWVDMGIQGEVHTFTLVFENLDGGLKDYPEIVAFIRFGDGGLVHRLGAVSLEEVHIGMPVEAVFRPPQEREGSILDIAYFKPVGA